jgi:SAM-dependent methyltransferase
MADKSKAGIEAARRSFNEELLSSDYPVIHDDREAIARLVDFVDPQPGGSYLDLATGRGAMAFALAKRATRARVIGVDIADQALAHNHAVAMSEGLTNLEFQASPSPIPMGPSTASPGAMRCIISRNWRRRFPSFAGSLSRAAAWPWRMPFVIPRILWISSTAFRR